MRHPKYQLAELNQATIQAETLMSNILKGVKTKPVPLTLDIADAAKLPNNHITPELKHELIKNQKPEADFSFPPKKYKDSSEPGGVKQRYCCRQWFDMCRRSVLFMLCFFSYASTSRTKSA